MPTKVLVTGATGTVGSAILECLAGDPTYEVHAVVRKHLAPKPRVVWRVLDLDDPLFPRQLADVEYDSIIHAAQPRNWSNGLSESETFDIRVIRGLESLCTKRTRRLIYTGGVWVYGHQEEGATIDEMSSLRPVSYAVKRMKTLEYLRQRSQCAWIEVALPSFVYGSVGPLQDLCGGLRSGSSLVLDDRSILWSLVERTDVGDAYRLLIECEYAERVFLVAEPQSLSVVDIHERVAAKLQVPFVPISMAAAAARVRAEDLEIMTISQPVNSTLFRARTGWRPKHSFATSFTQFIVSF